MLLFGLCYNKPMRLLNGRVLADYIKERQAHDVRVLAQTLKAQPKLAIIVTIDNPIIDVYVRQKKNYGADILVDVAVHRVGLSEVPQLAEMLNNDISVQGIIIQLPLEDPSQTDAITNLVSAEKDVDALGSGALYDPATPMAILWLLAGYNIDLANKHVLLIGRGKLVGQPLEKMLQSSGVNVTVADRHTADLAAETLEADVIITATGSPAILHPDMLKHGTVIIDAGVANEKGKTVGDVAPAVYEREDLIITPTVGGVGPLTVCALFENVIRATRFSLTAKKEN
jgi:methylenetetrahydrofolate dehydrogenase (NADP+)/methenyltetrahydrofolate cyclohydrolase